MKRSRKNQQNNRNSWLMLLGIGLILAIILTACGDATPTTPQAYTISLKHKPALIFSTTNSGAIWNLIYTNPVGGPRDFITINCPTADTCFVWQDSAILDVTYDGGNHWGWRHTISGTGGLPDDPAPVVLDCPDVDNCYLMGESNVDASYDGGASWDSKLGNLRGAYRLRSISCPGAKICFVVGTNGLITTTSDGGKTWRKQTSGSTGELTSVNCQTLTICLVTGSFPADKNGNNGISATTSDGGRNWTTQYSSSINKLSSVTCPLVDNCYAIGVGKSGWGNRVFVTKDGGKSWQDKSPAVTTLGTKISCPNVTTCYIANIKELVSFTFDGGNSWVSQSIGLPRELRDIACVSSTSCFVLAAKDEG